MEQKETYWSRFANDFEERNNYVAGKDIIEQICHKIASLDHLNNVLELGCGNGTYTKNLVNNSTSIIATDFSDEMVEVSTLRLKNYQNIRVEKANCHHLHYADHSFDTVFMANLLHVISKPEFALQECKRVLKPGGKLIIISFTQVGMRFSNKLRLIYRYLKVYGKPPKDGRSIGLKEASIMIQKQGFRIKEAELLGCDMKALFIRSTVN